MRAFFARGAEAAARFVAALRPVQASGGRDNAHDGQDPAHVRAVAAAADAAALAAPRDRRMLLRLGAVVEIEDLGSANGSYVFPAPVMPGQTDS